MTSNINPNNIDGTYPVAGQDNNSQGFRDNFTNTKTNFQYAADEITDLQNNVILKSALSGTTLDNDMGGSLLYNYRTQNVSETVINQGTISGSVTLNYALGSVQTLTTGGAVSFAITNWPSAGKSGAMRLIVTVASTAHTLSFPSSVNVNTNAFIGWNTSTNVFTAPAAGTYVLVLYSRSGGADYFVVPESVSYMPSNTGSEDLAPGAAASLSSTISYFSTSGAETATLAAGVNGQIKTFAMYADSGDMVITVTNAGWKTSGTGTITFDTIGDSCTLQYINSKWFCIGNNGCVFA